MTLIRNSFLLLTLALATLSSACKEESAKKVDSETHAAVIALEEAIENVELAEARGLALTSASPETATVFKRILTRSKAAAGLLRIDSMDLTGLTELVRSRDELRNLTILTEDFDTIGIYRTALEKAVAELAVLQGVKAYDLSDPNSYHDLYSQTFNLGQKLGDFTNFVELRDARGPKLFEPDTCGEVCGNAEYVVTDVNSNQAVWLLSPRLTLPDSDMKLILKGYVRGVVHDAKTKGFRVYVSENFTGAFTGMEGQWTEITSMVDPYLPADKSGSFTANVDLDSFRGKSLTFAIRVQGLSKTATLYQMHSFTVRGKGRASMASFSLATPEPLLFKEPEIVQDPVKPGELPACVVSSNLIDIKTSCRIDFTAENVFQQLLGQTTLLFSKYNHSGQNFVEATTGGWKAGTSCDLKPTNPNLQSGLCPSRFGANTKDFLVSPPIKLGSDILVKIRYTVVGHTRNKFADGTITPRLRALVLDLNKSIKAMKANDFTYGPNESTYDVQLQDYPDPVSIEKAALREMTLDPGSLAAKIGSSSQIRLALLQSLEGVPYSENGEAGRATAYNSTSWYVYSIDFIKAN